MRLLHVGIALSLVTAAFADTVTLKNGRVIEGTYSADPRARSAWRSATRFETLDVTEIDRIEFGGVTPRAASGAAACGATPIAVPCCARNDRPDRAART